MMGKHRAQKNLFNYCVDLDQRVRAKHPLRKVLQVVDFSFVREEVKGCYGINGSADSRACASDDRHFFSNENTLRDD